MGGYISGTAGRRSIAPALGHGADLKEHITIQDLFGEAEASAGTLRIYIKTPVHFSGEDSEAPGRPPRPIAGRLTVCDMMSPSISKGDILIS